ncbi:MAG: mechanosensitive ion channel family protein [Clostridiales bacterium]|nr:mechanosensitive ion channel family protein [Clostridiales bacterium]
MTDILAALKGINLSSISAGRIIVALLYLIICLLVIQMLLKLINRTLKRLPIEASLHGFIRSLAKIILYFITTIIIVDTLGISVTSLVAVLGVAGIAISLAAQSALGNVAGGLMLLSSKPFVVGDYIEVSGVSGTVVSIGLAYTKLKTPDNKIIFAPNNIISGEKIINYTTEIMRRVDTNIHIAYDNDPVLVKKALLAAIQAIPGILEDPAPYVNAQLYEEKSIVYTIRVWVYTHEFASVKDKLMEQLQPTCLEAGIKLAYPNNEISKI